MLEVRGGEKKRAEIYRDGSTSPYLSSVCSRIEFASTPVSELPNSFTLGVFRNDAGRTSHYWTEADLQVSRRILFPIENP